MANSILEYDGTGSQASFTCPSYLEKSHIIVTVNNVTKVLDTDYTISGTTVTLNTIPASGVRVKISRKSNQASRLNDYSDASLLTAEVMDADANQLFFMAQEAIDTAETTNLQSSTFYSASATLPTSPAVGDIHYDTSSTGDTTAKLKVYDGTSFSQIVPTQSAASYSWQGLTEIPAGQVPQFTAVETTQNPSLASFTGRAGYIITGIASTFSTQSRHTFTAATIPHVNVPPASTVVVEIFSGNNSTGTRIAVGNISTAGLTTYNKVGHSNTAVDYVDVINEQVTFYTPDASGNPSSTPIVLTPTNLTTSFTVRVYAKNSSGVAVWIVEPYGSYADASFYPAAGASSNSSTHVAGNSYYQTNLGSWSPYTNDPSLGINLGVLANYSEVSKDSLANNSMVFLNGVKLIAGTSLGSVPTAADYYFNETTKKIYFSQITGTNVLEIVEFTGSNPSVVTGDGVTQTTGNTSGGGTSTSIDFSIPSQIYVASGSSAPTYSIYLDNISHQEYDEFNWFPSSGYSYKYLEEKIEFDYAALSTNVSTPFTLDAYAKNSTTSIKQATTTLNIAKENAGTGTVNVMVIGDSTTQTYNAGDKATGRLLSLFASDAASLNLVGTIGVSPNLTEGRSGARASQYVNDATAGGVSNAFYHGGAFNFSTYMSTNSSLADPDFVFIHLGLNDLYGNANLGDGNSDDATATTIAANLITNLNTMITSIHAYDSAIKVGVCLPIHASSQDGAGDDYGETVHWMWKRSITIVQQALLAEYDTSSKRSDDIYAIGYHLNLDTDEGFSKTNGRHNNFLHPTAGYNQMGDTLFGFIKFKM